MSDRDERGRFLVGNKASQGNCGFSKDIFRLKREWYGFWNDKKFAEVLEELHRIALGAPREEDRLTAIEIIFSRHWGKPVASVQLDVSNETAAPIVDLSEEEMNVVEKILNKTMVADQQAVRAIESA
jgi:hypothetical protein